MLAAIGHDRPFSQGIVMTLSDSTSDVVVADVFAEALTDQGVNGELLVERAGGGLHTTSLRWWLRQAGQRDPVDFASLGLVTAGPVLDIGCATGRHLERLGRAGVPAEGIDLNPATIALGRLYGCTVQQANFWQFRAPHRYRWVLALGNNVGIAGRLSNFPKFLDRLAALLSPGGEVLLSSVDPGPPTASNRCPGEMRLRHHYAGRCGPWFDWLYVSPDTLATYAHDAGFTCRVVHRYGEVYVAVLTLAVA
jgi:SAM-dependent methyltransferase